MMIDACPKRLSFLTSKIVVENGLPVRMRRMHVFDRFDLFWLSRATSLIYKHWPGNNQLGDNAAAAIASLIHALPKLKSLLLAGNILGCLVSGRCALMVNGPDFRSCFGELKRYAM